MKKQDLIKGSKRIVIKVGSALLIDKDTGKLKKKWLESLAFDIKHFVKSGKEILLVSSGSIALGKKQLNLSNNLSLDEKQAAAATGQITLAHAWSEYLGNYDLKVAQILLAPDDTETRRKHLNARATLIKLIELNVIPVINENDTVATEEIRFGDNDRLASRVAQMCSADLLILLSDINGLYSSDPSIDKDASLIETITEITNEVEQMAGPPNNGISSGGMITKIEAARRASLSGTHTIIANGKIDETFFKLFNNKSVGTFLESRLEKKIAKKKWLADNLRSCGRLILDKGASIAILEKGKSLLPIGVLEVEGKFDRGEVVSCVDSKGIEIAKGLVNYNSVDSKKICGVSSDEIKSILGFMNEVNIIHRDNLVVM